MMCPLSISLCIAFKNSSKEENLPQNRVSTRMVRVISAPQNMDSPKSLQMQTSTSLRLRAFQQCGLVPMLQMPQQLSPLVKVNCTRQTPFGQLFSRCSIWWVTSRLAVGKPRLMRAMPLPWITTDQKVSGWTGRWLPQYGSSLLLGFWLSSMRQIGCSGFGKSPAITKTIPLNSSLLRQLYLPSCQSEASSSCEKVQNFYNCSKWRSEYYRSPQRPQSAFA